MGSSTLIIVLAVLEYNIFSLILRLVPTCKFALQRISSYNYAKVYATLYKTSLVYLFMVCLNLKYVWFNGLWKSLYSDYMAETMSSLFSMIIMLDITLIVLYEVVLYRNRLEIKRASNYFTLKKVNLLEI